MNRTIADALAAVGARFKRHRKHVIYETRDGKNIVVASTPSDRHAEANALRQIARISGVEPERPKWNPDRRVKPGRREREWTLPPVNGMSMASGDTAVLMREQLVRLQQQDLALARARDEARVAEAQAREYARLLLQKQFEYERLRETRWVKLGKLARFV